MINHDFTSGASLTQEIDGSGTFTGVAEIGRALASVGSGNAGLSATAWQLGAHMNGMVWQVKAPAALARVELEASRQSNAAKAIRYTPTLGDTSEECAAAFPALCRRAYESREAATALAHFNVGVSHLGDGSDAPVAGVASFAGGIEPDYLSSGPSFYAEDVDAGLICFDAPFPITLTSFFFSLAGSVAWELRLSRLAPDRRVQQYAVLASGTAQRGHTSAVATIPPGWGLSFVANTTGSITAHTRRIAP